MALLYNSSLSEYVGCISTTDFVHALITYEQRQLATDAQSTNTGDDTVPPMPHISRMRALYRSRLVDAYLKDQTIEQWRGALSVFGEYVCACSRPGRLRAVPSFHGRPRFRQFVARCTSNARASFTPCVRCRRARTQSTGHTHKRAHSALSARALRRHTVFAVADNLRT